jgi:hypothetical protein
MADQLNPAATEHLPAFITAPGQSDVLMVVMALILGLAVFGFGVFYWRLHSLPERIAHKGQKVQFEIVAILGLVSLFTHNHIFWIAGLLLAFIDIPNFAGFFGRIAGSVEKIAGLKPGTGGDGVPDPGIVASPHESEASPDLHDRSEPSAANTPLRAVAGGKEADHA